MSSTKKADLGAWLAQAMAGMTDQELGNFRKNLTELLPVAINQAAEAARSERAEVEDMTSKSNQAMNNFIRGRAGQQPAAPEADNQALLDRAAVYVEKTGCSVAEALEVVGLRPGPGQRPPVPAPAPASMSDWIRREASKP